MKNTVFLAVLAAAICFLLPFVIRYTPEASADAAATAAPPTAEASPEAAEPAPAETDKPAPPAPESLTVLSEGVEREMRMQDYLIGVVAAEMPAYFEPEALKAQAVAARTYALYCAAEDKHGLADVCTDHACCQEWQSEDALREKWGDSFDAYYAKIASAVEATEGCYITCEGRAVLAAFHSSSAAMTESSAEIWGDVPYLVSVSSPESASDVPNYVSCVSAAALDFRDTLLSAYPDADFTGDESEWVGALTLDASGRVSQAEIGGVSVPGTALRSLFALRSTAFSLGYEAGVFTFTVTGYGHGVGMSQYGANVMAKSGESYDAILAHYYPGTKLMKNEE